MGGTLRYLLAGGFAALFALIALREPDHEYIAFLHTKSWLMAEDSPLVEAVPGAAMPPFAVDVLPATRAADYERIGREWARAAGKTPGDGAPLLLQVRVGDAGFRATLLSSEAGAAVERGRLELTRARSDAGYYPDFWSLLPAFLAIVLAIATGRVIPSLLAGCLAGALVWTGDPLGAAVHFGRDTLWQQTLIDTFRVHIMLFVVFLFMAVGVMARSGGIQGMVAWIQRFARGPVSSQLCSYLIGILIFFDDYSNCIISGSTMRPLTDRCRVAREKLAYIVDSTAAPVAGISLVSTWIAYEISMFRDQLPEVTKRITEAGGAIAEVPYRPDEAFSVFVQTLPYRFYCVFTLLTVLLTIVLRREFGPMLRAARRAFHENKPVADDAQPMLKRGFAELEAPPGAPLRGRNGFVPVVVLVGLAVALMLWFGSTHPSADLRGEIGQDLRQILSNASSEVALMWASLVALFVAGFMAIRQRILSFGEVAHSAVRAASSLVFAIVILILAWCIGNVCKDLGTATFLTAAFHGSFEPWLLPVVMFALSSLVSFSTGTSYGTMAILLPNVVVLAHTMGRSDPAIGGTGLMLLTIGAVLEGSIFGDHCSPISDTTVLSSVATASDHMHHVNTQAPYALLTMVVAMVVGYVPMALISRELWPLSWAAAALVIAVWLLTVGRNPMDAPAPPLDAAVPLPTPQGAGAEAVTAPHDA